jgi:hypothetical protein
MMGFIGISWDFMGIAWDMTDQLAAICMGFSENVGGKHPNPMV